MDALGQFVPLILIFAIMWFLLIRPQQKKMKEHRAMVAALRKNDKVITQGGIFGKVAKVHEGDEVDIEIAAGVQIKVVKSTISEVLSKPDPISD